MPPLASETVPAAAIGGMVGCGAGAKSGRLAPAAAAKQIAVTKKNVPPEHTQPEHG